MIKQTFTRTALAAVVAAGFFAAAPAQAQTYGIYQDHQFDYTTLLTGNITDNAWVNLTAFAQAGVPGLTGTGGFPGTTPWASPQASQINNSVGSVGGSLGGATLNKLANGAGGGPYAASGGIYYGGMSSTVNYDGGRLGVADSTPLSGRRDGGASGRHRRSLDLRFLQWPASDAVVQLWHQRIGHRSGCRLQHGPGEVRQRHGDDADR